MGKMVVAFAYLLALWSSLRASSRHALHKIMADARPWSHRGKQEIDAEQNNDEKDEQVNEQVKVFCDLHTDQHTYQKTRHSKGHLTTPSHQGPPLCSHARCWTRRGICRQRFQHSVFPL
jgi:hypothetical protein